MYMNLFTGILVSVVTVTMSIIGLLIVRKISADSHFNKHHDVTDPMLSVVGTLFAILLGFMVANSMQRFEEARVNVQEEANAIMDLYRLAEGLPKQDQDNLREHLVKYNETVVSEEWIEMRDKKISLEAYKYYDLVWSDCATFKPKEDAHNNLHQKILDCVTTLSDCRRMRLYSLHNGLPKPLWGALAAGGLATIVFTYFFRIANVKLQCLMTGLVTLAICLNLFLLASFDDPFSGDVAVSSMPFEINIQAFRLANTVKQQAPAAK
jgi:hypothetical protein